MKLYAPDWKRLMFYPHDFALLGLGRDFQNFRQRITFDHQRMIPGGGKWIGHPFKQVPAVMFDQRRFAMHHPVIHHHLRPERVADTLVTQANPKNRDALTRKRGNHVIGQAGFPRRARPRARPGCVPA